MIKLQILTLLVLTLSSPLRALSFQDIVIPCTRDPQDSTSCTFSGLEESTQFYRSLVNGVDLTKNLIKKISFENSQLTHMPKELTTTYTNLEHLDASNVQLWRFVKIDFGSDLNIKKLNLSSNKIHEITTDVCTGMTKLESLDLSHNLIDLIDRNAFSYNENFKYLNLSHNRIGKLSDDFFRAIRSVLVLHLNNNRISSITGDLSGITMNLEELYLNNNELIRFDPILVKHANYLDVSSNNIEGDISFADTSLTELNIRGNSLDSITINNQLKTLDTADNTKRSFSILFGSNVMLTEVNLSNLDIISYEEIINSLKNLYSLEVLDLSQNNLELFDFKSLHLPISLKSLNLRRTDLHTLKNWENMQNYLPNLKEIDIQDNFLSCKELPTVLETWQQSNISIIGFSNGNDGKFVEKNCAEDSHKRRRPAVIYDGAFNQASNGDGGNLVLVILLVLCLLGYVVGAIFYLNSRFDIIERLVKRSSGRASGTSQFQHTRANLLDEVA